MITGAKNKRLAERVKQQREEKESMAQAVDPKGGGKGGKQPPP